MKKKILLITLIIILFIVIIINIFKEKNYEIEYEINGFNITENYNKELDLYTYKISNDKITTSFVDYKKYTKDRKLITDIEEYEKENEYCIILKSEYLNTYPLCTNGDTNIDYHLVDKELLNLNEEEDIEEKEYNNISIYNLKSYKYITWNYRGFDILTNDSQDSISIFDADQYNIPLAVKLNKYLVIADYNSKYTFNKFYIINLEKNTKEEMEIKYDISFDSYILGTNDNSIYLVDKKSSVEYEIVPHKKKIRIVGTSYKDGTILEDGKWNKISLTKLSSETYSFTKEKIYDFYIEDKSLYLKYNNNVIIKISNQEVDKIIYSENDKVFYLIGDTLYSYSINDGEIKAMNNFEWNFNYENNIFVYIS